MILDSGSLEPVFCLWSRPLTRSLEAHWLIWQAFFRPHRVPKYHDMGCEN